MAEWNAWRILGGITLNPAPALAPLGWSRGCASVRPQGRASMAEGGGGGFLGASLAGLEVNVLIAGIESAVCTWVIGAVASRSSVLPITAPEWSWVYAVLGLFGIALLFIIGLGLEGLAGIFERWVKFDRDGNWRSLAKRLVRPRGDWVSGQKWIWTAPLASEEFSRRRTRILVARNTSFSCLTFGLLFLPALIIGNPPSWRWWLTGDLLVLFGGTPLFLWVWFAAERGWNDAVEDAGNVGDPPGG